MEHLAQPADEHRVPLAEALEALGDHDQPALIVARPQPARVALVRAFPFHGHGWPWATFIANVAGTAAVGYLTTRLQERLPPSTFRRPLLGTGFCGGLTTFSTMQVELVRMLDDGRDGLAAAYAGASIVAGTAAIVIGTAWVRRVRSLA